MQGFPAQVSELLVKQVEPVEASALLPAEMEQAS
jgi:hypothetical protein